MVVAGGPIGSPAALLAELDTRSAFVACADSGADHLGALGLVAQLWMGDGDSVSAVPGQAESHRFPAEKDETDLELVLEEVARRRLFPVALLGALGGRLDHELANLHLAAAFRARHGLIALHGEFCRIRFVVPGAGEQLRSEAAYPITSLVPLGGDVTGVRTRGLQWNLAGETLSPWRARGVSNRILSERAEVRIEQGVLALVEQREP